MPAVSEPDLRELRGNRECDALSLTTSCFDHQHRFPIGDRQSVLWGLGYRLMQFDTRIGWQAGNWELAVIGQDLIEDRHPEFGQPRVGSLRTPRSVYGKAGFRW
ncbi:MAG: hypothetical protein HY650_08525 [Acidobacteria bacterium]|nr:hypothetical protein [Acidobacteriota bacterium]